MCGCVGVCLCVCVVCIRFLRKWKTTESNVHVQELKCVYENTDRPDQYTGAIQYCAFIAMSITCIRSFSLKMTSKWNVFRGFHRFSIFQAMRVIYLACNFFQLRILFAPFCSISLYFFFVGLCFMFHVSFHDFQFEYQYNIHVEKYISTWQSLSLSLSPSLKMQTRVRAKHTERQRMTVFNSITFCVFTIFLSVVTLCCAALCGSVRYGVVCFIWSIIIILWNTKWTMSIMFPNALWQWTTNSWPNRNI